MSAVVSRRPQTEEMRFASAAARLGLAGYQVRRTATNTYYAWSPHRTVHCLALDDLAALVKQVDLATRRGEKPCGDKP